MAPVSIPPVPLPCISPTISLPGSSVPYTAGGFTHQWSIIAYLLHNFHLGVLPHSLAACREGAKEEEERREGQEMFMVNVYVFTCMNSFVPHDNPGRQVL